MKQLPPAYSVRGGLVMWQYEILDEHSPVGTVQVTCDGLYRRFRAVLRQSAGLHRLYLHAARGVQKIGVFSPEGDTLTLSRRIAANALPDFTREWVRFTLSAPEWLGFDGEIAGGIRLKNARFCRNERGATIAIPCDGTLPDALVPVFCLLRVVRREEKSWFLLDVDEDHFPILSDDQTTRRAPM